MVDFREFAVYTLLSRSALARSCGATGVGRDVERDLAGREHGADLQQWTLDVGPNDQPEQMGAGGQGIFAPFS